MTALNEVVAELALEPRSRNSQPGLFLTPEPQWDARGLESPRPVSCQPAPEPLLSRLPKDAARHSQQLLTTRHRCVRAEKLGGALSSYRRAYFRSRAWPPGK